MSGTRPLRYWWSAPAFAILLMVGAWAWSEREDVEEALDARFFVRPELTLAQQDAEGEDARLQLDWRSRHDGIVAYHELDVTLDGAPLAYVGHDPGRGQWSAQRGDLYLARDADAQDGDVLVIGDAAAGQPVLRLAIDPCDCEVEAIRLR